MDSEGKIPRIPLACAVFSLLFLFSSPSPQFSQGQKGSFWRRSTQAPFPHHSQILRRNPGSFFPPLRGTFLFAFLPQLRLIKSAFFSPTESNKNCQEIQSRGGSGVRTSPGLTCELLTLCGPEELTFPSFPGPFPTPKLMFMTLKLLDQLNFPLPGCSWV